MILMRRILILFLTICYSISAALAYDIVLPKEKKTVVNGEYALFVGHAGGAENIFINDEKIHLASNGAFAKSVKLKNGENRIIVRSDYSTSIYKIYRNALIKNCHTNLVEFDAKNYVVKEDNTPLRNTPIDEGLNRISHLFKGTNIIINGEKGDFYRVFLSKNNEGWVAKDKVEEIFEVAEPPKFITMNSQTFKNGSVHTIEFTNKIPYTIHETEREIIFKAYNPQYDENSVYTINIKKPEKYYYKTDLNDGIYQIIIKSLYVPDNMRLDDLTIVVDAGHGGTENGAIGCLGDKEKNINLAIAEKLNILLTELGAKVIMTREADENVSLDDRVKIAKENNADIFVSVHLNSIGDIPMDISKNRGTSVFYYNNNSKELAKSVYDSMIKGLSTHKDGVKSASFAVIRPTDYVGILIEAAYMTNPYDSVFYREKTFHKEAAKAITEGIVKYVHGK